jgi:hypothetical protein
MRISPLFFAVTGLALAWSAEAQVAPSEARQHYEAELVRQCSDKQLQMLSPRALRDGLDQYLGGLSVDARAPFEKSETDHCSSLDAGASCVNLADIAAAEDNGRLEELVQSVCAAFIRCREQDDCDYAR